jgi:hypothetical protein
VAPGLAEQAKLLQQSQTKDLADAFMPFVLPPVGTACKNKSCQVQYEGPESDQGLCLYHPGYPVFHEGLKFWSCCVKRTSDFDEFLKQKGCETGRHCWDKMKGMTFQVRQTRSLSNWNLLFVFLNFSQENMLFQHISVQFYCMSIKP